MTSAPTTIDLMCPRAPAATEPSTLSLHDALPIYRDALALAHEHGRRRRLEDRRALDLVARRERVHLVDGHRSEEHTSELQSHSDLVCRLLLEKKKTSQITTLTPNIEIMHRQPEAK